MNDKEYKNEKLRIERYLARWVKPMGLGYWRIYHDYYDDSAHYAEADGDPEKAMNGLAFVTADWRYMEARFRWNCPVFIGKDDGYVEYVVVHELMHVFLKEMREEGIDHEERVATTLAKGILWADGLHEEEARKDEKRKTLLGINRRRRR